MTTDSPVVLLSQSWTKSISCSIQGFNCCFLTCIQVSQETGKMVWYSHLSKSFPQFVMIYTVKWSIHDLYIRASQMAQRLKRLPATWETWVRSLSLKDPMEKEMPTHSSILAWRIPWREEPGRLQSMGLQRVGHDWATSLHFTLHRSEISGWQNTAWMYPFPNLEPVHCSMSGSNCCLLTCIQVAQQTGKMVWYSHLFKNFPQFVVIHIVKDFTVVSASVI